MLVQPDGTFITARKVPKMVLLEPQFRGEELYVGHLHKAIDPLHIPLMPHSHETLIVQIWDDEVPAHEVSEEANNWFSEQLGITCKLVYMADDNHRQTDARYANEGEWVSFADGFPYLIIGQESLNGLNARLDTPMEMSRFRPNLVFEGGQAHIEDTWKQVQVGEAVFEVAKPCARCSLTTVDPQTAHPGKEPLKTLSTYRTQRNKVMFGMNMLLRKGASLKVGDKMEVLD